MKKWMSTFLAAVLLLSGCSQQASAPEKIVTGRSGAGPTIVAGKTPSEGVTIGANGSGASMPSSAAADEPQAAASPNEAPIEPLSEDAEKLLKQFTDDIANSAFRLSAESPETKDVPYQQIAANTELGQKIAKLLLENPVALTSAPEQPGRVLSLQAQTGNLLEIAAFHGFDDADPRYPGKMVLELDMDGIQNVYLYENTVFQQLDALYKAQTQGVKTEFKGNATLIASQFDLARLRDERGYRTNEFLQFGTRVLWRFTPNTDSYAKPSTIELLDTVTGKSLYSSTIQENVLRMEKFDGEAGFDYRVMTPSGILYRASGDRAREKVWRLPGTVSLFAASETLSGTFDMQHGRLAYADQDGIYLADQDGGNAEPVLFHSILSEIMRSAAAAGYTYYFNDPHFLLDGTRLATSIVSPQTGTRRLGFAITDLDTMETAYFTGVTATDSASVRYLGDKAIAAQDEGTMHLINGENYDRGALPLNGLENSSFLTYDCNKFAVWEPKVSGTSAHSSTTYLCDNTNIMDRSKKLLDSYGGPYAPVAMTEEYLIGLNEDSRGVLFAITRYQTLRDSQAVEQTQTTASSGSSSKETASKARDDEDDSSSGGDLPPDITPDL